ncbi:MAG TPA: translation initiation factor IF-2 [Xanthomonadaceae bacterium]|nr:translation initiation factor IF-2 [Xanthomonadaceae bacterium]
MSDVTVKQLASALNLQVDKLLEQLSEAGMKFSGADQVVTSTEKMKLLGFLRRSHGKQASESEESAPKKITLRRRSVQEVTVGSGPGKAKTVNIEVRAKRTYVKRSLVQDDAAPDAEREEAIRLLDESRKRQEAEEQTRAEQERKRKAEEEMRKQHEEERKRAEEERAKAAAEAEAEAERDARLQAEEQARALAGETRKSEEPVRVPPPVKEPRRAKPAPRGGDGDASGRFGRGELHLSKEASSRRSSKRRTRRGPEPVKAGAGGPHAFSRPTAPVVREIEIGESIQVGELAQRMAVKAGEVIKALMKMGVMATINQPLDHDTAALVVEEMGHTAKQATDHDIELELLARSDASGEGVTRPPVVTIMGHVDHGKTSLLDYIRRTKVASGEAGGITQHIGAYHVTTAKGVISFLDTPGHAAFTSMRARGAKLTDIVVLVVAADDGVMPQTVEAVQHARAAGVPIIVAINKMDKPEANPDNVKQGLGKLEVIPEEWGGENIFVPVSAKTGDGIDSLLDAILVQSEVMELTAPTDAPGSGVVVESALDKGRGPVATVLVQQGTLRKGDFLVCGVEFGRVRAMFDEGGAAIQEAGPSIPAVVLGLSGVPDAGDDFVVVEDERLAKDVAQKRQQKRREARLVKQQSARMEDIMTQMESGVQQSLNLVIKADVQGSVEALRDSLTNLSNELVRVNVIASGVGGITESDATLASASKAILIGFNVRADASARKVIQESDLDIRYFSIIYDVIDQVKQVATGLLGTEVREEIIGTAEVRDVFRSSKFGAIAGCMVAEGVIRRGKPIRVLRDNVVIFQGELESLRRYKENVDEVKHGTECGIGVKQYNDVKPGDQIECYERVEVARTL